MQEGTNTLWPIDEQAGGEQTIKIGLLQKKIKKKLGVGPF